MKFYFRRRQIYKKSEVCLTKIRLSKLLFRDPDGLASNFGKQNTTHDGPNQKYTGCLHLMFGQTKPDCPNFQV